MAGRTQRNRILWALQNGDKITPMIALRRFGVMRLAARVCELREIGYRIRTKTRIVKSKTSGKIRVAEYSLDW